MVGHTRWQFHADRARLGVQNGNAMTPIRHTERRNVRLPETPNEARRERVSAVRIIAREEELVIGRRGIRGEGGEYVLRGGMPVEHVHVVDDDDVRLTKIAQHV